MKKQNAKLKAWRFVFGISGTKKHYNSITIDNAGMYQELTVANCED